MGVTGAGVPTLLEAVWARLAAEGGPIDSGALDEADSSGEEDRG